MLTAIDFDSVIVKRTGIPTNSNVWTDLPMEGAIETLWLLKENKIDFYIFTNRPKPDWKKIKKWLNDWKFPDKILVTNVKQPGTSQYLDDRAIRFTNFNDFRKLIGL